MTSGSFDKSWYLYERSNKVIPGGVTSPVRYFQPYPFFVEVGNGSKLFTSDGTTLTDYCLGYGAVFLGHANPKINSDVKNQIDKGNLFCTPTEKEVDLAEICTKIIPCAEMVRIMNTGAEATMHSIRLARAFTKRKKIIKFDGCYHGAFDYVLDKAGSGASKLEVSDGILSESASKTITIPYNDIEILKSTIEKKENENDIAGIIIEPIVANSGLILPEKEYLSKIRDLTKINNIVLIFDEVVTGFRLALGGASEFFGIKPDIATFAKALGNGYPISLLVGNKDIMSQFAPRGGVYQASTFAGNPISVTAALSTLEILMNEKNSIYPSVVKTCDKLVATLRDTVQDKEIDATINSIGSMFQIFFTKETIKNHNSVKTANLKMFHDLFRSLLKKNIYIPPSQFETCFLSAEHNEEDIEKTVEAYEHALAQVKKN